MQRYSMCTLIGCAVLVAGLQPAFAQDEAPPPTADVPPTSETDPAADADAAQTDATPSDTAETSAPIIPAAVSRSSYFFGTPDSDLVFASTGYSGVLRGGYMTVLGEGFVLGAEFILDAGLFNSVGDGVPGTITVAAGAPMKFTFMDTDTLIVGLTATPGLGVTIIDSVYSNDAFFTLLLHAESNVGYKISDELIIGGGIDFPMTFIFGDANVYLFPLLLGPAAEYQITEQLSIHTDFKIGPHIATGSNNQSNTTFGLKFEIGAAWVF